HRPRERDASKRVALFGRDLEIAIEPAVARRFQTWSGRLHVVLRVEMRSRVIRRSAGVDDGQRLVVPERFERRHRGVKTEESIEIDRRSHSLATGPRN